MQLFSRPDLLRNIRPLCEDSLVKVLTGLRRSGKSSLLRLIAEDMAERLDRPKEDFLFLDLEDFSLRRLARPEALHDFLLEKAKKARKRLAVFLDEVRTVESWEKVVRSLQDRRDCDLFVATSGADPFLGESAALLSDRIVRFEVTPYSFREFRAVRKSLCPDASEDAVWQDFLVWGGMPAAANRPVLSDAEPYLIDVFRSILLCDVTNRRNLRDTRALETTLALAAERCGDRISLGDFAAFLASQRQTVSRDTLADYLRAAADAGLLLEVEGDDPNPPLRRRPERFFLGTAPQRVEGAVRRRRKAGGRLRRRERRRASLCAGPQLFGLAGSRRACVRALLRHPGQPVQTRPFPGSGASSAGRLPTRKPPRMAPQGRLRDPRVKKRPGTIGFVPGLAVGRIS